MFVLIYYIEIRQSKAGCLPTTSDICCNAFAF